MKVATWSVIPDGRFLCVKIREVNGAESRHGSFVTPQAAETWARENLVIITPARTGIDMVT